METEQVRFTSKATGTYCTPTGWCRFNAILDGKKVTVTTIGSDIKNGTSYQIVGKWADTPHGMQIRGNVIDDSLYGKLVEKGWSAVSASKIAASKLAKDAVKNPYSACGVPGIGFKRADKIAIGLGVAADNSIRISSMITHGLDAVLGPKGHTLFSEQQLRDELLRLCEDEMIAGKAFTIGEDDNILINKYSDVWTTSSLNELEKKCSIGLATLLGAGLNIDNAFFEKSLTDEQLAAVKGAIQCPLSVITGGAGVGKTFVTKSIYSALVGLGAHVVMVAPTGKAARRMSEMSGADASTIHRSYGVEMRKMDDDDDDKPCVILCDESSMLSLGVMSMLLSLRACQIVFIGDAQQLPPVGSGHPFRDMIGSGVVPVFKLTKVLRQAEGSKIIDASLKTINGEMFTPDRVEVIHVTSASGMDASMVVNECLKRFKRDEIQLLSAKNADVDLLNVEVGHLLRLRKNNDDCPEPVRLHNWQATLGDRMVFTRNDSDLGVVNGQQGIFVRYIETKGKEKIVIADGDQSVEVPVIQSDILRHAFAMTCHKAQGSQWPCAIVNVSGNDGIIASKQWLYTAMTRAEKCLVVVGDHDGIAKYLNRSVALRRTQMMHFLKRNA